MPGLGHSLMLRLCLPGHKQLGSAIYRTTCGCQPYGAPHRVCCCRQQRRACRTLEASFSWSSALSTSASKTFQSAIVDGETEVPKFAVGSFPVSNTCDSDNACAIFWLLSKHAIFINRACAMKSGVCCARSSTVHQARPYANWFCVWYSLLYFMAFPFVFRVAALLAPRRALACFLILSFCLSNFCSADKSRFCMVLFLALSCSSSFCKSADDLVSAMSDGGLSALLCMVGFSPHPASSLTV